MDFDKHNSTQKVVDNNPAEDNDPFSQFSEPRETMKVPDDEEKKEVEKESFFEIVPTSKDKVAEKVFNIFTVLSSELIGMITGQDSGRYVPKDSSKKNIIEALEDVLPDTGGNMPPWVVLLIVATATYVPIAKNIKQDLVEKKERKEAGELQKIEIIKNNNNDTE